MKRREKLIPRIAHRVVTGRSQREKLGKFHENYTFFYNQRYLFDNNNVNELYSLLDDKSKKDFYFDTRNVNRFEYALGTAVKAANDMQQYMKKSKEMKKQRKQQLIDKLQQLKQRAINNANSKQIRAKL